MAVQLPRPGSVSRPSPFSVSRGIKRAAHKIGVYGPGGVGKSSLISTCPGIVIADVESSTQDLDVTRVEGVTAVSADGSIDQAQSWSNLRAWVQQCTPVDVPSIGIDSLTRAENWATAYVIKNKKSNENVAAKDSVEDYKYGAGATFVLDEMLRFLGDLDAAFLRGCNIIMVAHDRIEKFRNPDGSDYFRQEPRLFTSTKGAVRVSLVEPWIEFLDHLACVTMDVAVVKGKATGGGSRTIYVSDSPARRAKSRTLPQEPIPFDIGSSVLWDMIFAKKD